MVDQSLKNSSLFANWTPTPLLLLSSSSSSTDVDYCNHQTTSVDLGLNQTPFLFQTGSGYFNPSSSRVYPGASELLAFNNFYRNYHGYLAAVVCVFGTAANVLNIVVLSQRDMFSATNCILTGLAISDGLTMLAYLPFALRFYVLYGSETTPERNTLAAVRFLLFYACFSVVVHTVSIWLTVTLATFRYILIRHPRHAARLCTLDRAKTAVFLVYLVSLVVCLPNFTTINVQGEALEGELTSGEEEGGVRGNVTFVWTVRFKQNTKMDLFLYSFNFWIQALLVKLLPCVGLTILSVLLVRTMRAADARRRTLRIASSKAPLGRTIHPPGDGREPPPAQRRRDLAAAVASSGRDPDAPRTRKTNRTTRMLLAVVALFLVTEFPQGVVNLLSGLYRDFAEQVYLNLGDLIDILALTNNGINFILYCTMSKQFRDRFVRLFCRTSFAGAKGNNGATAPPAARCVRRATPGKNQ